MSTKKQDRKEEETAIQFQREQQQAVNKALDETKDSIKKQPMKQEKRFHVILK